MSRARRKIEHAAAELGYVVEAIRWEPLTRALEMGGPQGGWYVQLSDCSTPVVGYSVQEVLDDLQRLGRNPFAEGPAQ